MGTRPRDREPLLPRAVLVTISLVVTIGWLATVALVVLDPANSGPLLISSGVLTTVIGAAFGVQLRRITNDSGIGHDVDQRTGDHADQQRRHSGDGLPLGAEGARGDPDRRGDDH